MTVAKFFSQGELEAIADALGHMDIPDHVATINSHWKVVVGHNR